LPESRPSTLLLNHASYRDYLLNLTLLYFVVSRKNFYYPFDKVAYQLFFASLFLVKKTLKNNCLQPCLQIYFYEKALISIMNKIFVFIFSVFAFLISAWSANGQTITTASWRVLRYDINASLSQNERALTVRATLTARNVGGSAGTTMTLRVAPQAEIKTAKANDAEATFRASVESVGGLQRVVVNVPRTEQNATINVAVDYRLPVASNSGYAALSPLGSQFLPLLNPPESLWYPTPTNPFLPSGWDTAPFRLTVTTASGEQVISSGKANGNSFEQTLNAQPFFLTGNWDTVEGGGEAKGISAYLPKGASVEEKKQAEAVIALAATARSFYSSLIGPGPDTPIRFVAVSRGAGFNDGGTILVSEAVFRRNKVDSETALLIASSLPRLWIGGESQIRGEGYGAVREGLPRYLSLLFWEKQFGSETTEAERKRLRLAHALVAKRDAPIAQTTVGDENYFSVTANKGSMVWRLVEKTVGKDAFLAVLRSQLQKAKGDNENLTLASLRAALNESGTTSLKGLLDQMLTQPTDIDLLVGLPQQKGGAWTAALRNLGSADVTVNVVATTQNGEKLTTQATIGARNFSEASFKTPGPLVRVEVDPEKLYPQTDYSNDIAPRPKLGDNALLDVKALFNKQDYVQAEAAAKQILQQNPSDEDARALLARILLAQNKLDEAEREFQAILKLPGPSSVNQAWVHVGLGEILLRKGQNAEAIKHFTQAIRVDGEYGATLAARANRVKAEAAQPPAPDEAAKSFVAQMDKTITSTSKSDLNIMIVPGELKKFASGVVGSQPEIWQTKVVRTEMLDQTRMAVDVTLATKTLSGEQSGTAVYILAKVNGVWKLAAIEYFEVR
jgi:TolA-binding protein